MDLHTTPSPAGKAPRQQARLRVAFTAGGDSRCATGEPSDQKVSGQDSHLTKAEIPNGSAPQGLPPGSATPPALGRSEGGEKAPIPVGRGSSSGPDPALSPGRPAQAALRAGRARVRAEGGRPGAGVPPAVPPSLLPSPKHHQHQMAKRLSPRRERCAAAGGTGSARPPLDGAQARGTSRPAAALPRPSPPGNRAAAGAGSEPAGACALRPPSR